ncbi:MAG: TetR/AcrR family transcriptional regulator [Deltaproteobacteria bacterium]|nr:TetR/AcrR family transcriptional regulator [Deltaproteobacteria bacterium]
MSTVNETVPQAKIKLIEVAAELVYHQGWNATGMNQILGDSKVPKGSFYYYYESKDDLGVSIVHLHAQKLRECYDRTLCNGNYTGRQAFGKFFEEQLEFQRRGEWRYGCAVGSFSNEVAATTEKIAQACRESFEEGIGAFGVAIERGRRDGTMVQVSDTRSLATAFFSAWQGALLAAKTFQQEAPLRETVAWIEQGHFRR